MTKSVIFLHIPKTAGQSVHAHLALFFEPSEICPARENFQLLPISVSQLRRYRLFSGHLDFSLLDAVPSPRFVFTILRQPIERLLSFYFFLRSKAQTLSAEQLRHPQHRGLHAALTLSPDDYFCGGPGHLRQFIDNHYDNFYTYYFAGRTFDARQKLNDVMAREYKEEKYDALLQLAIDNLETLDRVYTIDNIEKLEADLISELGAPKASVSLVSRRVNVGEGDFVSRLRKLRELGATKNTFLRLQEMTALDDKIWSRYSSQHAPVISSCK